MLRGWSRSRSIVYYHYQTTLSHMTSVNCVGFNVDTNVACQHYTWHHTRHHTHACVDNIRGIIVLDT